MEKINRVIVEASGDVFKSERDLSKRLTRALGTVLRGSPFSLKIKGFNATMARERKRGKAEKTRFQANGKANGGHHARGGIARAKLLTPAERSAIASKAAKKRWKAWRASQ
jgi:hypothetical protein